MFASKRLYKSILFYGSDNFSLYTLKKLQKMPDVTRLEVVCPIDKRKGYKLKILPVPVKEYALQQGIPVHHPDSDITLKGWNPPSGFDHAVVVSFRYFIPNSIIQLYSKGIFNVHPSLLPKYQGAAPLHHTILNGDLETGVSIIELHPKMMDCGDILDQVKIKVDPTCTYSSLYAQLGILGSERVEYVLNNLDECKRTKVINPMSIDNHATKVTKEMGQLTPQTTATLAYNKFRAFESDITLYAIINGVRVILRQCLPPIFTSPDPNNTNNIILKDNLLYFRLTDGFLPVSDFLVEKQSKTMKAPQFAKFFDLTKNLTF
jgi:methionyl-tRNA formyltransferase